MAISKGFWSSCALGLTALALAAPTHAFNLVEDSGWQFDTVNTVGSPSVDSPVTFTVGAGDAPGIFSLTDAFVVGDIYTVSVNGGPGVSSVVGAPVKTNFDVRPNNYGPAAIYYAPAFLDSKYSHLQLYLAPGAYSLSITGDCGGTCPAGLGIRLDSPTPEPATWALMLVGMGALGAAVRSRRHVAKAA